MFRTALIRRIATRAKMPSLRNLASELLLNVINRLSVHDIMTLSQQSRGVHALYDVKNRQKYHQLKFGREKLPQTHEAVLQAGLDILLAILRFLSLRGYLGRADLYGTGMIEFISDSSIQNSVLPPKDIPPSPRSANCSKISFTHSIIRSSDLCRFIESAKTLKCFTSAIGSRQYPKGGHPVLYVTPILKSLWIHRQTLEELNLDIESQTSPTRIV
jgi:hypothetical protein